VDKLGGGVEKEEGERGRLWIKEEGERGRRWIKEEAEGRGHRRG
jgi:hypothetical protein